MKAIIRYSVSAIDFLKEVVSWLRHTKCDCINRNLAYEQALAYEQHWPTNKELFWQMTKNRYWRLMVLKYLNIST